MVLIDTSAWIEFFRRRGELPVKLAVAGLRDEMEAALCGPVIMEFLGGMRPMDRPAIESDLDLLPYIGNDQRLWKDAAAHYSALREKAITAPWNDVLIATIALKSGCRLYAVDRHFQLMAPVIGLRLYEPGYNGIYRPETD